jgi:DNA-binding response OmpR family regulator
MMILDINMPLVDGLTVACEIGRCQQLKDVPIIFLTCTDGATDIGKGIQVGARRYITKPFALSQLADKVARATGSAP